MDGNIKKAGKYVTNSWKDIDGKRYYFDANGYRVTGWQTLVEKNTSSGQKVI